MAGLRDHRFLLAVLAAGLLLRVVLLFSVAGMEPRIVDELHYQRLAANLIRGNGFAFEAGTATSIRPPLYPFFLAAIWKVAGTESLQPVRAVQIVLSLVNVILLYRLGLLLFDRHVALLAASGLCFYPSLLFFNFALLTEVVFTFFLTLMLLGYGLLAKTGSAVIAWATGCALGLAALTRSILWPLPVVLCPIAFASLPGSARKRFVLSGLLLFGFVLTIAPWAIRNTRLQGVFTVVDTMGGMTLRQGNYEHTPDDRMWDAVSQTGEKNWAYEFSRDHPHATGWTEGRREKWARQKALEFMTANPGLTLRRSMIKFADFWGLEREFIAGVRDGRYRPPRWFATLAVLAITISYIVVMMLASLGIYLAPPRDQSVHAILLLIVVFMCGVHVVVFGHSRYHLPLMPILLLYAAAAISSQSWRRLREGLATAAWPVMTGGILIVIWGRELLVSDVDRIKELLRLLA